MKIFAFLPSFTKFCLCISCNIHDEGNNLKVKRKSVRYCYSITDFIFLEMYYKVFHRLIEKNETIGKSIKGTRIFCVYLLKIKLIFYKLLGDCANSSGGWGPRNLVATWLHHYSNRLRWKLLLNVRASVHRLSLKEKEPAVNWWHEKYRCEFSTAYHRISFFKVQIKHHTSYR